MPVLGAREAKYQRAASTPTSANSSSSVTNSPGALGHRDFLAVAHEAHPGDQQHADGVAVEAQRLGGVLQPRHGAVVVGAPDVDQLVEAAAELLDQVADVGGEVGRLAVGPDHDAVLVVAELGRAEPQRAVLLVHVAGNLELLDAPLDPTLACSEPSPFHMSKWTPRFSRLASMPARMRSEAHSPTSRARRRRVCGQLVRQVDDVFAVVAIVGDRLAAAEGQNRCAELVDLGARVVEVVLARDLVPDCLEHAAEQVADEGAARVANVSGPVGLALTNSTLKCAALAVWVRP